mgnify:CR=1 FL=1
MASADIDLSSLVSEYTVSDILVLGVKDGETPGSNKSKSLIEELDDGVMENGALEASLSPGEIMQVVLTDIVPTDEFQETWDAANSANPFGDTEGEGSPELEFQSIIPDVPIDEPKEDGVEERDAYEEDEDDLFTGLGWAGGLLLLLAVGAGGFVG